MLTLSMGWQITYYSENVRKIIDSWPVGIRAFYARLTERIKLYGPNLGMPFTRSMGHGLFEIRAKGNEGIGRAFFCTVVGNKIILLRWRFCVLIGKVWSTYGEYFMWQVLTHQ